MNCNVKPVIWECPCHLHKFVDFCAVTWNEFTNENDISPQEAKKEANIKLIKSTFNKENHLSFIFWDIFSCFRDIHEKFVYYKN